MWYTLALVHYIGWNDYYNACYAIILFNHVGGFHELEYVNYIKCASRRKLKYLFTIHTFRLDLDNWVELYSQHYAEDLLFIPRIFVWTFSIPIVFHVCRSIAKPSWKIFFTIFLLFKQALFIFHTDIGTQYCSYFLSSFPERQNSGGTC